MVAVVIGLVAYELSMGHVAPFVNTCNSKVAEVIYVDASVGELVAIAGVSLVGLLIGLVTVEDFDVVTVEASNGEGLSGGGHRVGC